MKAFLVALFLGVSTSYATSVTLNGQEFEAVGSSAATAKIDGKDAIRVTKSPLIKADDEATFAKLKGSRFSDGTIQVKVLSRLLPDAPQHARGFIGIAFRIDETNAKFESIYIRPTNGRVDDQLRRNRSVQYFSYPDFKFDRLRKEASGLYETYADMGLNEWITLRVVVKGKQAKLFLNDNKQPSLVVNDLKHGSNLAGAVALFVDVGTEGFFRDLELRPDPN
jgi:hypothetical protein